MFNIFKWFFGIVAVIIFAYVIVVAIRALFSTTTEVVADLGNGTSTSVVASSTNIFKNWLQRLYSPAPFVPGAVILNKDVDNTDQYRNPIADNILRSYSNWDFYGENQDDFDVRWGGKYSNPEIQNNIEPDSKVNKISDKLPKMLFPSPILKNLQPQEKCVVAGCSMHFCVDQSLASKLVSTCEYRAEYACYRNAVCERDLNTGKCGWKVDNALATCLQGR